MSKTGILHYVAQNRAYNAEFFCLFLNELKTKLSALNMQSVVLIVDNVKFHKVQTISDKSFNFRFEIKYLPPYPLF